MARTRWERRLEKREETLAAAAMPAASAIAAVRHPSAVCAAGSMNSATARAVAMPVAEASRIVL